MSLEILHRAFVFFRGRSRIKGAEVLALAGLRIFLPGVKPILSRFQLRIIYVFAGHDPIRPAAVARLCLV